MVFINIWIIILLKMDFIKRRAIRQIYLVFFLFGISSTIISPLTPWISDNLSIGYDKIGLIFLISTIFGIISTTVAGKLCDSWNIKNLILIGLVLITLGFLLFGIYLISITLIFSLIFLRIGSGIIDSSSYALASRLSEDKSSIIFMRMDLFFYIGAIISPLIIGGILFFKIDPKLAFLFLSGAYLVTIILFLKGVPGKDSLKSKNHDRREKKESYTSPRFFFLKDPIILTAALMLFFFFGSLFGLISWLTTYFLAFDLAVYQGSLILSLYWVFLALGLSLSQKIIRKTNEITIILIGNLLGTASILIFGFVDIISVKIIFLMLNGLFISGIGALTISISVSQNRDRSGTITGFIIAFGYLSGVIFQPMLGYFAEYIGEGSIIYIVLIGFVITLILSFILYRFLKKKNKAKFLFIKSE